MSGAYVLREDEPLETIFLTSVLVEKAPAAAATGSGSGWQEKHKQKSLTLFDKCLALKVSYELSRSRRQWKFN